MRISSEQIAEILRHAPTVPSFKRTPEPAPPRISDTTKAKLIALHAAYATFGHPRDDTHQM